MSVSIVISLLIFVVSNAIISKNATMNTFPMFSLIKTFGSGSNEFIFSMLIWCSVMTTCCSCLCSLLSIVNYKKESRVDDAIILLSLIAISGILSLIGFNNIVEYGYSFLGCFALAYLLIIFFLSSSFGKLFLKKCDSKIHKSCKYAKN